MPTIAVKLTLLARLSVGVCRVRRATALAVSGLRESTLLGRLSISVCPGFRAKTLATSSLRTICSDMRAFPTKLTLLGGSCASICSVFGTTTLANSKGSIDRTNASLL
jgi:hypothetical protein